MPRPCRQLYLARTAEPFSLRWVWIKVGLCLAPARHALWDSQGSASGLRRLLRPGRRSRRGRFRGLKSEKPFLSPFPPVRRDDVNCPRSTLYNPSRLREPSRGAEGVRVALCIEHRDLDLTIHWRCCDGKPLKLLVNARRPPLLRNSRPVNLPVHNVIKIRLWIAQCSAWNDPDCKRLGRTRCAPCRLSCSSIACSSSLCIAGDCVRAAQTNQRSCSRLRSACREHEL